jgi:hypothetical protein
MSPWRQAAWQGPTLPPAGQPADCAGATDGEAARPSVTRTTVLAPRGVHRGHRLLRAASKGAAGAKEWGCIEGVLRAAGGRLPPGAGGAGRRGCGS